MGGGGGGGKGKYKDQPQDNTVSWSIRDPEAEEDLLMRKCDREDGLYTGRDHRKKRINGGPCCVVVLFSVVWVATLINGISEF